MKKGFKNFIEWIKKNKFALVIFLFILASVVYYFYYIRENQLFPKATLYFMDDLKMPKADQKVLIFSPHPDDETIAAGGLIYESILSKAQVKIVLVTDGNKHHLKDKRYTEFEEATSVLGVKKEDLTFLNYKDGELGREDKGKVKE